MSEELNQARAIIVLASEATTVFTDDQVIELAAKRAGQASLVSALALVSIATSLEKLVAEKEK